MLFGITLSIYILKHLKFSRASADIKELRIPSQMGIPCLTPFIFVFSLHPLLLNIRRRPGKRVVGRQPLDLTQGICEGGSDRLDTGQRPQQTANRPRQRDGTPARPPAAPARPGAASATLPAPSLRGCKFCSIFHSLNGSGYC